jgi:TetR/AcrR family transcriptional regulator
MREAAVMTRTNRRQEILEAFAMMLEESPGSRITTAALARHVGVSEAALYRHFPSKAKMIEGLIEFMEASVFTRISRILEEEPTAEGRCRNLVWLLLSFAERNPGFARLLAGDALQGETERLRTRMRQFFDRLETQLRQILREGGARRLRRSRAAEHHRESAARRRRGADQPVRAKRIQSEADARMDQPLVDPRGGGVPESVGIS